MRERCHRCYTILTSEDKYHYEVRCESCEVDYRYEEAESNQLIKSPYWKWRAICFGLRWLSGITGAGRDLCVRSVRSWLDAKRKLQHVRRRG